MRDTPPLPAAEEPEIAIYVVSRDGIRWRDYDPRRDEGELLHKRIVFAQEKRTELKA